MKVLDKEEVCYIRRQGTSKLKQHDKENENKEGLALTSGAARQKEKQEKLKRDDQGMKRHAVKDV